MMLTMRPPLQTAARTDYLTSNDGMARRMAANYGQMREFIAPEDLLHVVTQPPEIFLLGGGESVFSSETNIKNQQIQKVSIINNAVNRILLAVDGKLSYQDQVYITNVLHKLGITDERAFMKQVFALTEETKNVNALIRSYETHRQALTQLLSEYKNRTDVTEGGLTEEMRQEVWHLHEDVFKRWDTAALYNELSAWYRSTESGDVITGPSYRIAEETRLAQQITLQNLRETIRGEQVPLVYRHENIYEGDEVQTDNITREMLVQKLSSAVFLSMIDAVYQAAYNQVRHETEANYRFDEALYQAADNVFARIVTSTAYRQTSYETARTENIENKAYENELNLLTELSQAGDVYLTETRQEQERDRTFEEAEMTFALPQTEVPSEEIHVDARNSLAQQVYEMEQNNIRRQQEYITNLQNLVSEYREEAEAEEQPSRREETLLALEHPEVFAREFAQAARQEARRKESFQARQEALLPESTREILTLMREYLTAPEQLRQQMRIREVTETQLIYDTTERIQQTEERAEETRRLVERQIAGEGGQGLEAGYEGTEFPTAEMVYAQQEARMFRQLVEALSVTELPETEILRTQTAAGAVRRGELLVIRNLFALDPTLTENTQTQRTFESLFLAHRTESLAIDEEEIARLRQEMSRVENTTRALKTEVESRVETVEQQIQNTTRQQIVTEETTDVTQQITRTTRQQIDEITDRVYSRLERQLNNERMRRGLR